MELTELKARVHSRESAGTVDGPGLRYVVFMQGCPLRCKFCHNPDTWDVKGGTETSVGELLADIVKYKTFMDFSGGGVTISGGEPLLHKKFVTALFFKLKQKGIHTAIDTSGYTNIDEALDTLLDYTDLVMLDLKQLEPDAHEKLTGVNNARIIKFLEHLKEKKKKVWIRYVVLPGSNDSKEYAEGFADFVKQFDNVELVELLPYHEMGKYKWEQLGLKYELDHISSPSKEKMKEICDIFCRKGIRTLGGTCG